METARVSVWNLVQYLIVHYELRAGTFAHAALTLGGALLCILVPYLLGSLNPAVLLSRRRGADVRETGDGTADATDLYRPYGVRPVVIAGALELLKTALAYWFGFFLFFGFNGGAIAGFFALFGHLYPVFHKFRGGKGTLCLAAVALCTVSVRPFIFAILLGIWLIVAVGTRFLSLASVMTALLYPLILRAFTGSGAGLAVAMAIAGSVFVIYRHKPNLSRLYRGKEPKFRFSRQPRDEGKGEG